MHNQEIIKMGFDPNKSENETLREIFKCRPAMVIWCSIKSGHITNQYFNDEVLSVGKQLSNLKSTSFTDFMKVAYPLSSVFGRVCVNDRNWGPSETVVDNEFWGDIYKAIHGQRCFKLEFKTEERPLETVEGEQQKPTNATQN